MKKIIVPVTAVVVSLGSALASARVSCGNLPSLDVYGVAGPSCAAAKAVVKATNSALIHGKLYQHTSYSLTVGGKRWHLTWHFRNTSGTIPGTSDRYTEIESYRATRGHLLVTFHTYGAN